MELSTKEVGRIIAALDPHLVEDLANQYGRLSNDIKIIPTVLQEVKKQFPDLQSWDEKIFFITLVYRIFSPLSFLPKPGYPISKSSRTSAKLPAGVRDEIARCLGFKNAEMCNHFKTFGEAHIKNPRYRAKMDIILQKVGLQPLSS